MQYGPGQNGTRVIFDGLLSENDKRLISEHYKKYDYNAFISDMVPVPRILPDYRPDSCRRLNYPSNLPKVSVIIPFRNERLSVLLRTVYGILFYSPEKLLEEIILIDDASTEPDLKHKLDVHVRSLPQVILIRKRVNVGLMMARQAGIDRCKANYFICMDSHMEVSLGWLEPILNRLVEKPKALLCSNLGAISNDNFMVSHNRVPFGIAFDFPFFAWNFEQQQARYSGAYKMSRTNLTEPILMGSVMGMMICMKKSWFQQLGGFDPGMRVWGSEQIELSVKVWMCGGLVEMIPCSYVAHIYRRIVWNVRHVGMVNKYRLVETWVDEPYKQIIYDYSQEKPREVNIGDISDRVKVREENQCKSFQYFLDKVREFSDFHIPTESKKIATLTNFYSHLCLDRNGNNDFPIQFPCNERGSAQLFELTERSELRHLGHCLYITNKNNVMLKHCDHFLNEKEKEWSYSETDKTLKHELSGNCLTGERETSDVTVSPCSQSHSQKWIWEPVKIK
ncbi:polypeptide N-acetylgalactosaminyltransferase 13-like isoform X2 [Mercenaria mercenaria]|nr:polypeptide N-acetylgalactosaminyltransferase 13-like isoform X2 [Mercenaria mercenaria]